MLGHSTLEWCYIGQWCYLKALLHHWMTSHHQWFSSSDAAVWSNDYYLHLHLRFLILHWCRIMDNIIIYVHLHLLRLQHRSTLPFTSTTTSIHNYIDYSSAVGLDSIALPAVLTVRRRLCNRHHFLMLPSTEAGQTLPLIYIHSWSMFIILAHCTMQWLRVCLHCTEVMPADLYRLCETFHLNCIVVF